MDSDWSPQKRSGPHCVYAHRIVVKTMRHKKKEKRDVFAPGPPTVETLKLRGVCIGGRNVNNLRYADDTALLVDNSQ